MSRRYYTTPPTRPNVPEFVYKRYAISSHVQDLIQWSIKEYDKGLRQLSRHASPATIRFFIQEYSPMRVLAESEGFRDTVTLLDMESYNRLNYRERVFVRRAWELYKSLS